MQAEEAYGALPQLPVVLAPYEVREMALHYVACHVAGKFADIAVGL